MVRWVQTPETGARAHPPLAPGMGIQFTQLDDTSRSVVDRMVSLREKRGLAYSVYSYTTQYADGGIFAVYAGCAPGKVDEVLSLGSP